MKLFFKQNILSCSMAVLCCTIYAQNGTPNKIKADISSKVIMAVSPCPNPVPNPGFRNTDPAVLNPKFYCWHAGLPGSYRATDNNPYVDGNARAVQVTGWWVWMSEVPVPDSNKLCMMTETIPYGSNCIPYPPTNDGVTDNIKLDKMLHIKTGTANTGIVTVFQLPDYAACKSDKQVISCWVYVVKGKVSFNSAVNSVQPTTSNSVIALSSTTCQWEKLTLTRNDLKGNQIDIFSSGDGDAEFYVCNVKMAL